MKINKRAKREAKALFRFCMADDALNEGRARQVTQQIAAAGYRNSHAVLAHFLRLVELHQARHAALVESATNLPEDLRTTIETGLRHRYGRLLTITYTDRPELIGGVRIQVASDVYDSTVLTGLETLEQSF